MRACLRRGKGEMGKGLCEGRNGGWREMCVWEGMCEGRCECGERGVFVRGMRIMP